MSKLDEIKQALEAATPGPWAVDPQNLDAVGHVATNNGHSICQTQPRQEWVGDYQMMIDGRNRNAHLIANAPTWLAELLKVAEAAQTMLDAIDKGAVDSEEIVPVPGDGSPYRFHEEWAHRTRKALEAFTVSRMTNREERARMEYAEHALRSVVDGGE